MDIKQLTPNFSVAPQIEPGDMAELAAKNVKTVISNRPDSEVPPSHQANAMRAAAEAQGIEFVHIPITQDSLTPESASAQLEAMQSAESSVLAFCRSGTRSTVVWAMGQAMSGGMPVDDIIQAAEQAGYDLTNMRPVLSQMSGD